MVYVVSFLYVSYHSWMYSSGDYYGSWVPFFLGFSATMFGNVFWSKLSNLGLTLCPFLRGEWSLGTIKISVDHSYLLPLHLTPTLDTALLWNSQEEVVEGDFLDYAINPGT